MGISGLGKLVSPVIENTSIEDYINQTIGFDAFDFLYKGVIAIRARNGGNDTVTSTGIVTSHINAMVFKVLSILSCGIIPFLYVDGKPHRMKKKTLLERQKEKDKINEKLLGDISEAEKIKLMKHNYGINNDQIDEIIQIFDLMGIPSLRADGEADQELAASTYCITSGAATEDWDILLYGGIHMFRNFSSRKTIEKISLNNVLHHLDLTHEQFIELCILLGTDYNSGIKGMSPEQIYQMYKNYKNIPDFLLRIAELNIQDYIKNNNLRYTVPDDLLELWPTIKYHFMNVRVVEPMNLNKRWKCPEYEKLKKILIERYEFDKKTVNRIIFNLHKYYKSYSERANL